ncbi:MULTISPECIES: cytochrome c oxidase assembly protein [Candidatus Ichthyocystis]|uniref:Cytochrome c oxidase assembly protein CtaG n=1 Tax=Candidatus Ichthyocystis hellenicum TaxID=1561003 RepID=A0A0S4LZM2_9BURK|nr:MULTISPECIES: cytochrome c oxidase assembly protein [Ichthyocystis]CUT17013.1 cytochrome c oxidase assembly protein [Candidatus Ichthyocystis hellenicum]
MSDISNRNERLKFRNRVLFKRLLVVVVSMAGFSYALVPIYRTICNVAGLNDVDRANVVGNISVDKDRTVRIEFDSNTAAKLPWKFRPLQRYVDVHPGEIRKVFYEIENITDHDVRGQAIPSYGPNYAQRYFLKLQCFCFTQQTLKGHEKRRVAIVFVIDPKLPRAAKIITLSYTFFGVDGISKN